MAEAPNVPSASDFPLAPTTSVKPHGELDSVTSEPTARTRDRESIDRENRAKASDSERFISEEEAARWAGVSIGTLRCFADVGALSVSERDGTRWYSARHVESLFAISIPRAPILNSFPRSPRGEGERLNTQAPPTDPLERSAMEKDVDSGQTPSFSAETSERPLLEESLESTAGAEEMPSGGVAIETNGVEIFKKVLESQQHLLAMKDAEIADLKSQRSWLQQRVEKLEQQSDRDRLILLSEAHTIKQLVAIEANRKSKLRAALEFFGIVPVQEPIPAPSPLSVEFTTPMNLGPVPAIGSSATISPNSENTERVQEG